MVLGTGTDGIWGGDRVIPGGKMVSGVKAGGSPRLAARCRQSRGCGMGFWGFLPRHRVSKAGVNLAVLPAPGVSHVRVLPAGTSGTSPSAPGMGK